MSHLSIRLLGTFQVHLDGEPVTAFESAKARALLAYLAVESGRPQRRERLAGLLWAEYPEQSARRSLSQALFLLRRAIGDRSATGAHFLLATRDTVQFNPEGDHWLDVAAFTSLLAACKTHHHPGPDANICVSCIAQRQQAVDLYGGPFLDGFSVADTLAFEEWSLLTRDRLHRAALQALQGLADGQAARGAYEQATDYARRGVELDPWREEAHRELMRLLALNGRRGEALAQYEICRRTLAEELGGEPGAEIVELYERIRDGTLTAAAPASHLPARRSARVPAFLAEGKPFEIEPPVFVSRERELARLDVYLKQALSGEGQVLFITGEAGAGKTALLSAFARRAMGAHPKLLLGMGNCNAYAGVGDPYLPFREVLGMLTGDVEARWAGDTISRAHAQRLWQALPLSVQALLDHGPHLVDTMVPGAALLARAEAASKEEPASLARLRAYIDGSHRRTEDLEPGDLFQQATDVLRHLANRRPLLLLLDDLQWIDTSSASLLFHLGRRLAGARILILGAFRPEEVTLDPGEERRRHPLQQVLGEFKRLYGDAWLDLSQADETEHRRFVDALLATQPNRLGEGFRNALARRAGGHPLFTIELLRTMQERGDLVKDAQGAWVAGRALDWAALPTRVEAVIEERIGRLDKRLREMLAIASVEGEQFTAQVVAQVQGIPERDVLRGLSQELGTRHRLVHAGDEVQIEGAGHFLSRYRFAHALFQRYLYTSLSAGERRLLHGEVAAALEGLYGDRREEITVALAHHYAEAQETDKAIEYLLQAGDAARGWYAHQEAIDHYRRALKFLQEQKADERAARTLMKLGLTHHLAFEFGLARAAYDEAFTLGKHLGNVPPAALPPAPHALRIAGTDPPSLDPTRAQDTFSPRHIEQLFSGLTELTPEMDVVPDVARSWEVSQDGRHYVFHLRDDVRWSDGTPVTAGDFVYAWKRLLDSTAGSHYARLLYDIRGARAFHQGQDPNPGAVGVYAFDDLTLVVELDQPTAYFLQLVACWATYPVPRHVVEARGPAWTDPQHIVTNGPFRLKTRQPGESIILSRNPAYHGHFTGNLKHVEIIVAPSSERFSRSYFDMHFDMYEAGQLDIVKGDAEHIRQARPEEYVTFPRLMTAFVAFDTSRPPFDDVRIRQAVVMATDRVTAADVILRGQWDPGTGGFVPPGMPRHSPEIGLPYDPDLGRQLLTEADFPKQGSSRFPPVEAIGPRQVGEDLEFLRKQWREILGLDIEWQTMELGAFLKRLQKKPPNLFHGAWTADYPDPDSFLRASPVLRDTRWRNKAYQMLVEQARGVMDQEQRIALYRRADRILIEEAAIVPLNYLRGHLLVKPWVRRYPLSPLEKLYCKDVIIKPH